MTDKSSLFERLRCPVCGECVEVCGPSAICRGARRHCFDFAKSGYLNLTAGHGGKGDLKESTDARHRFLGKGYYALLANRVAELAAKLSPKTILDAGCGEGYYTNRLSCITPTFGADLSKSGIDLAAKDAKRKNLSALYAVASLFTLPVSDASFDLVTNLFAPCAEDEFCRVLAPGGYLLVVGAGEDHLMGLKKALYDEVRKNPGREDLPKKMRLVTKESLTGKIRVAKENIGDLFSMTPYYFRTSQQDKEKLSALDALETEIAFDLFLYKKT